MAVSEAKRKANTKWDSKHMATLACKVKKTQAEAFQSYCAGRGQSPNTVLKEYVLNCIEGRAEGEVKNITAREILNLIDWLREQGMDNDKIVDCLEAVRRT